GWNLDINTVRLSKNYKLGDAWGNGIFYPPGCPPDSLDPACIPAYAIFDDGPHVITITFPNGRTQQSKPVVKFKQDMSDAVRLAAPWRFFNEFVMVFDPLPGTDGKLTARGLPGSLFLSDDTLGTAIWLDQNIVEHPDTAQVFDDATGFDFVGQDGRTYTFDRDGQLTQLADANGNTLTITANGIFHSSGKSITWTRDAQGRITTMTDPKGQEMHYFYDAAGEL